MFQEGDLGAVCVFQGRRSRQLGGKRNRCLSPHRFACSFSANNCISVSDSFQSLQTQTDPITAYSLIEATDSTP